MYTNMYKNIHWALFVVEKNLEMTQMSIIKRGIKKIMVFINGVLYSSYRNNLEFSIIKSKRKKVMKACSWYRSPRHF